MNFFGNLQIRGKMILILLAVSVLSLFLFSAFDLYRELQIFKRHMVRNLTVLAGTVGANSREAIVLNDAVTGKRILSSLKEEPQIEFAVLYGKNGNVFVTFSRDENVPFDPPILKDWHRRGDNYFELIRDILLEDKVIGKIYLRFQMKELRAEFLSYAFVLGLILLATLGIVFFLSIKFQNIISKPIISLAGITKEVSKTNDYSIRVHYESQDELGVLSLGFNRMLEQIERETSELKQAKERLRGSEQWFRSLIEQAADEIYVIDADRRLVDVNQRACDCLGYTREELLKLSVPDIGIPVNPEEYQESLKKVYLGEQQTVEGVHRRKDGTTFPVEIRVSLLRLGEKQFLLALARDITEYKHEEASRESDHRLLKAISDTQSQYITESDSMLFFSRLLPDFVSMTQSEYGFIGEVLHTTEGKPYLKTYTLTDISWNKETRELYEKNITTGFEFHNLDTLFGEVIKTAKPVISNNFSTDPRRGGLPGGHPPLNTFLGLPVHHGEDLVGMVAVANRPGGYDDEMVKYLQPLLNTCGGIIEAYHNDQRRKHAEKKLKNSQEELQNLYRRLEKVREEEKVSIANEIHDELGQVLSFIRFDLSVLGHEISLNEKKASQEKICKLQGVLNDAIKRVQNITTSLHPRTLDILGLGEAIKSQCNEVQRRTGILCRLHLSPDVIVMNSDISISVYRIAQEALTNAIRHATPENIVVNLVLSDDNLVMEVVDDGEGITEQQVYNPRSFGLMGMKQRADTLGGRVHIESIFCGDKKNGGTKVSLSLPLNGQEV